MIEIRVRCIVANRAMGEPTPWREITPLERSLVPAPSGLRDMRDRLQAMLALAGYPDVEVEVRGTPDESLL